MQYLKKIAILSFLVSSQLFAKFMIFFLPFVKRYTF